ncbi:hypothetical protein Dimus_009374 [Dionaea muscipula]
MQTGCKVKLDAHVKLESVQLVLIFFSCFACESACSDFLFSACESACSGCTCESAFLLLEVVGESSFLVLLVNQLVLDALVNQLVLIFFSHFFSAFLFLFCL